MAEAFLQVVLENLGSLVRVEIGLILGVDEEMKKLSSTLTTIQAVLEDAEEKQLENKPIRDWLRKLTDLAFEIDDVLDECATHVSKLKHRDSKFSRYGIKKLLLRHNMGRRMKQVAERLDAVAAERANFHLREMPVERSREVAASRETGSLLNEMERVYGREKDKEKIVDILVNQVKENQETSVLPIIGVGGLGKTTLARLVFNDQRVVVHFEEKLWVCVSDDFDIKILIGAMIESATGSGTVPALKHLDALQRRLLELLNLKRYLIVLDDVWNDHQEKWSELKSILACGATGASIIVTTRQKKVAEIMGTLPGHHLAGLSEKHCWMLLRQCPFGQDELAHSNLEAIGKQIVKKCAGVPLASKALGGVLRFKRREEEWIYVKESDIWNLSPEETLILPALRLSYHHLPLALRQCFAYWAVFPKDHRIEKEELIFLWMAHGYISSKDMLQAEDVGNEICDELVLRSLLQVHEHGGFCMHDLVHDLAQSIMENKIPGTTNITGASYSRIREVNLLTSFVAFPKRFERDMSMDSILMKFNRLRVLDASFTGIKILPCKVANLKHLRRLDLSRTKIRTLPNSLCCLWNLQTLKLDYCYDLVALPKNTRFLRNLRHLSLRGCELSEMPPKISEITCLKTLTLFIVGLSRGNQLEELQSLDLGGEFEIQHLERVENRIDAKKANLALKKNLHGLSLTWARNTSSKLRERRDEEVLDALEPHQNVVTLSIRGFSGRCFPTWMSNPTLQMIIRIEIVSCPNCLHLPQLGVLTHLRYLHLEDLEVEYIIEDEVLGRNPINIQFPSLQHLGLKSLRELKRLFKEQVMDEFSFPNLSRIDIVSCCSSLILPRLPSVKELVAADCSSLTLASFSELDSLTGLDVRINDDSKSFVAEMLQKLTNLKSLTISNAVELSVPEEGLKSLKSIDLLRILDSETATCISGGWLQHLVALNYLGIWDCGELVHLPDEMKYLCNLQTLSLVNLPKMTCLPKALQHLSSLDHLWISHLPELNSLPDWLDHLTSLQVLNIWECPKLESLPDCIQGMSNLRSLSVYECPKLGRRCQRGKGEDWHKIAHIPRITVDHGVSLNLYCPKANRLHQCHRIVETKRIQKMGKIHERHL